MSKRFDGQVKPAGKLSPLLSSNSLTKTALCIWPQSKSRQVPRDYSRIDMNLCKDDHIFRNYLALPANKSHITINSSSRLDFVNHLVEVGLSFAVAWKSLIASGQHYFGFVLNVIEPVQASKLYWIILYFSLLFLNAAKNSDISSNTNPNGPAFINLTDFVT